MIWLTWRQQRLEALIGAMMAIAVAALLIHTGLDLRTAYQSGGVASCLGGHAYDVSCQQILGTFDDQLNSLTNVSAWLNVLPLFFGLLLAAPLALELENGTFRLAWTQSVPRMTWLRTKIILIVAAAAALGLAEGALLTWWRIPADTVHSRFQANSFDVTGMVFTAYIVFALAVAVAAGTLLRRAIPAIGITIVAFLAARFGVEYLARPHYVPPVQRTWFSGHAPYSPLDWVVNKGDLWRDRLGHALSYGDVTQICPSAAPGNAKDAYVACLQRHGFSEIVLLQPAGRFWLFQGIETTIFLGLSAILLGATAWWIKYRVG